MDGRQNFSLPRIEIQEKTRKNTEYAKRQKDHGNCHMQPHFRIVEVAAYHNKACRNSAEHRDECYGASDNVVLSLETYRLIIVQAFSALPPQVKGIKSHENSKKLAYRVDA